MVSGNIYDLREKTGILPNVPCNLLSFETNFQHPLMLVITILFIRRQVFKVKYTI